METWLRFTTNVERFAPNAVVTASAWNDAPSIRVTKRDKAGAARSAAGPFRVATPAPNISMRAAATAQRRGWVDGRRARARVTAGAGGSCAAEISSAGRLAATTSRHVGQPTSAARPARPPDAGTSHEAGEKLVVRTAAPRGRLRPHRTLSEQHGAAARGPDSCARRRRSSSTPSSCATSSSDAPRTRCSSARSRSLGPSSAKA